MLPPGGTIALDVRTYEWGTLFADVRSGNFEMAAMTWVGVADPDLYRLAYHSAMVPPAGLNRGRCASGPMDRLTDAGRRTRDADARRTLYARVQRWAAHDLPALPLELTPERVGDLGIDVGKSGGTKLLEGLLGDCHWLAPRVGAAVNRNAPPAGAHQSASAAAT